jgi:hypothetical protein
VKTLHYTPFSVLSDLALDLPCPRRIKVDAAFTGEINEVAKLARMRVEAMAKARQAREDSRPRVELCDQPLRVQLAVRDML